ncbi:hypothetical protein GCM10011354_27790 [Egicoccus halophilus]|uniref:Protein-glutamine gamma-glutamyltransferase-like C-terminal domain-containing protein n=1 Tax=Egicoccus halophilus TaxID=1670830 RepID=A0A8J3AC32_9ACTN|nr:hypothetical protein GCM10011354_27790 [Egicoccus halophilus]
MVVGLVAAVGVLVLAVLGASTGAPWQLEPRDVGSPIAPPTGEQEPPPLVEGLPPPPETGSPTIDLSWLRWVGWLLAMALAAGAVWWLWTRYAGRVPPPRRIPGAGDEVTAGEFTDEPELPVLRRGMLDAARALEDRRAPADAVIAAWLALEQAAEVSGVRRRPAQTPTEFTVAVLERTAADAATTNELLALYHRARFSGRPVGPDDVARARDCLGRLAADVEASNAGRDAP